MYWGQKRAIKLAAAVFFSLNLSAKDYDDALLSSLLAENKNTQISYQNYENLWHKFKDVYFLEKAINQAFLSKIYPQNLLDELEKIDNQNQIIKRLNIQKSLEKSDYKAAYKQFLAYNKDFDDANLASNLAQIFKSKNQEKFYFNVLKNYYNLHENNLSLYLYINALEQKNEHKSVIKLTNELYELAKNSTPMPELAPFMQIRAKSDLALKRYDELYFLDAKSLANLVQNEYKKANYKEILKITKQIPSESEYDFFRYFRLKSLLKKPSKKAFDEAFLLANELNERGDAEFAYSDLIISLAKKNESEKIKKITDSHPKLLSIALLEMKKYKELSEFYYQLALSENNNQFLFLSQIFALAADPKMDTFTIDEMFAKGGANADIENLYAYILIDFDIDYQKGIEFAQKACAKEPKDAYLDTLAWGFYKLKNCALAQEIFGKIKEESILELDELQEHQKRIKKCKN